MGCECEEGGAVNAKREGHENVSGKLKGGKERAKLDGAMRNELELLGPQY